MNPKRGLSPDKMEARFTLTDSTRLDQTLIVTSNSVGVNLDLAGNSRILDPHLIERGVANAINVGISTNPKFFVSNTVKETNSDAFIAIESHPTDRFQITLKIDSASINLNANDFRKAIRATSL